MTYRLTNTLLLGKLMIVKYTHIHQNDYFNSRYMLNVYLKQKGTHK